MENNTKQKSVFYYVFKFAESKVDQKLLCTK